MRGNTGSSVIFVYADGASRGNPGPASYGVAIVDESGCLLASFGESLGEQTNNYAEYQGVIAALRYLIENHQGANVTIRLDSKLVIEQLSGRWKIKHPQMRELAAEAAKLLRNFKVALEWIPREQNTLADAAANQALDSGDFTSTPAAKLELAAIQPKSVRAPRQVTEPTTIVVVRHGHTKHTEAGLISGSNGEDPSLSELGFIEAKSAANAIEQLLSHFELPELVGVYHSTQLRTTQTASAIGKVFNLPITADARLREIGFGNWEGISMEQVDAKFPSEVANWRGSTTQAPHGGESVDNLEVRVLSALGELIENNRGRSVAIVSHMMPARAIAKRAIGAVTAAHWSLQFDPASVSIYRFFGQDLAEVFCLNACEHLRVG
jgi:probable phosphoglycerate mutase